MRFAVLSAVLLQLCVCYGHPNPDGVGAFAYQDGSGNRYGGTYGLRDGQVVDVKGDYPPPEFVAPPQWGNVPFIPDIDNFFPEYFRNFEYMIQQNQNLALSAARKAFDLTSRQVGIYSPPFDFRLSGVPNFNRRFGGERPFDMSENSAFAGAAAGPGFSHHIASINPENPDIPNVDVTNTYSNPGKGGFYSVSSSSYSSSSNVNGEVKNQRGAMTKVNNNGVITQHKIQS